MDKEIIVKIHNSKLLNSKKRKEYAIIHMPECNILSKVGQKKRTDTELFFIDGCIKKGLER